VADPRHDREPLASKAGKSRPGRRPSGPILNPQSPTFQEITMFTVINQFMRHGRFFLSSLVRDERGVTTIEYGILAAGLALIIAALVADNGAFHNALNDIFEHIHNPLPQSDSGSGGAQ
jgi:pilus assembly protein Flp/PilA